MLIKRWLLEVFASKKKQNLNHQPTNIWQNIIGGTCSFMAFENIFFCQVLQYIIWWKCTNFGIPYLFNWSSESAKQIWRLVGNESWRMITSLARSFFLEMLWSFRYIINLCNKWKHIVNMPHRYIINISQTSQISKYPRCFDVCLTV